jgi:hypothetical protein
VNAAKAANNIGRPRQPRERIGYENDRKDYRRIRSTGRARPAPPTLLQSGLSHFVFTFGKSTRSSRNSDGPAARKLSPGQDHYNALQEIARFRARIAGLQRADLRSAYRGLKVKAK